MCGRRSGPPPEQGAGRVAGPHRRACDDDPIIRSRRRPPRGQYVRSDQRFTSADDDILTDGFG